LEQPKHPPSKEDQEVEYVMCSQCGTPSYVFEMDGSRINEATCLVCGYEEAGMFNAGAEVGADGD
jgi:ribosomal protein L37E